MLTEQLDHIDRLEKAIGRVGAEIEARMGPSLPPEPEQGPSDKSAEQANKEPLSLAQAVVLLSSIPGISRRAAEGILAEIGTNMDRFETVSAERPS